MRTVILMHPCNHIISFLLVNVSSLMTYILTTMQILSSRRGSVQIGTPPTPPSITSSYPPPPPRASSDKSLLSSSHSHSHSPSTHHHLKRNQLQGLSSSTTNLLDDVPSELSPLPVRNRRLTSPKHSRLTRAASMTSLGPDDASGMNEIVRCVRVCVFRCVCVCTCVRVCIPVQMMFVCCLVDVYTHALLLTLAWIYAHAHAITHKYNIMQNLVC